MPVNTLKLQGPNAYQRRNYTSKLKWTYVERSAKLVCITMS